MAEQNKETFLHLKELSSSLQNIARTLRIQYGTLSFLAHVEILCLIIITIFLVFSGWIQQKLYSTILTTLLLLIVDIVAIITYVRLHKQGFSFRQKYQEGRTILRIMADKAEWTHYKKRLIYKGNDEKVFNAIDNFFSISEKKWSPCRSERRYYTILRLTVPYYVLISFLVFIVNVIGRI